MLFREDIQFEISIFGVQNGFLLGFLRGGATGIIGPGHHSVRVRLLHMGWRISGQVGFSKFSRILPRGEGAGGTLVFIREAKIVEINVSEFRTF